MSAEPKYIDLKGLGLAHQCPEAIGYPSKFRYKLAYWDSAKCRGSICKYNHRIHDHFLAYPDYSCSKSGHCQKELSPGLYEYTGFAQVIPVPDPSYWSGEGPVPYRIEDYTGPVQGYYGQILERVSGTISTWVPHKGQVTVQFEDAPVIEYTRIIPGYHGTKSSECIPL